MEDKRGEFFVCVAGYPDNMEVFLKANPGLSSRFDKILRFEDYDPGQLMEIAIRMFAERKAKLAPAAHKHLAAYLEFLHKYRDAYFGNARSVRQLVIDIMKRHDLRLAETETKPSSKQTSRILKADVVHLVLDVVLPQHLGFAIATCRLPYSAGFGPGISSPRSQASSILSRLQSSAGIPGRPSLL